MTLGVFGILLIGVALNAGAQLLLRKAMLTLQGVALGTLPGVLRVCSNGYVLAGLGLYVVSVVAWLVVLSRTEVSVAYPMLSIGYIFVLVASHLWFGEAFTLLRLSGCVVIMIGVYLVSKSAL